MVIFLDELTSVPHIPASAARTLCDQRNRPESLMKLPEECRPCYKLMQIAKLMPRD